MLRTLCVAFLFAATALTFIPALDVPSASRASAGGLPDLVVDSISDAQQPFDCTTPAGVKVVVRNAGTAAAGPSTTYVSVATGGSQLVSTPGLAAGESVTIYSTVNGIPLSDTYTAVADFSGVISESNESNNSLTQKLALGTLPTCTPPPPVGGVSELIDSRGDAGTSWSAALIAAASAASLALAGTAWYMRKRRLAPD